MRYAIIAAILTLCSCDFGPPSPTAEQVCQHFAACASSYGNQYNVPQCLKDIQNIETKCEKKSAGAVMSCLVGTQCVNDFETMFKEIGSCYGACIPL